MVNDPKDDESPEKKDEITEDDAIDTPEDVESGTEIGAESAENETSDDIDSDGEDHSGQDVEDAVLIEDSDPEEASDDTVEPPDSDTDSNVVPEQIPVVPAPPAQASGGAGSTFGLVFGGLVAGAIGFLVATFAVPEGWPNPTQPTDQALADQIRSASDELAAQSERLDALQHELSAAAGSAESEGVDLGPLDQAVAALDADVATVNERIASIASTLDGFDTRLTELEARPAGATAPDGGAAMEAQLEAFRSELDTVTASARAEIEEAQARASEIEAEAAATAAAAQQRAALADIQAALESGEPFNDALGALSDVPEPLVATAENGVATLGDLQSGFPAAARGALATAQTVVEDAGAGERLAAFLRRQTNARSLSPQEGDGTDAVLSRAEAALAAGDLETTLSELEALPDAAQTAMSGWIASATERRDAVSAAQGLSDAVN